MGRLKQAGNTHAGESGEKAPSSRVLGVPSLLLVAVVVLALALRLWGITWGLPDQRHLLSYHPDEGVNLIQGVLDNGVARPHLSLGFYNYGGLYFYLWQGAVAVNQAYGAVKLPPTGTPATPSADSIASMILVGRLLTVLAGVLTVLVVYALGARLAGRWQGLIAALAYAITPAAVIHGHYATVDVCATLFVAISLLFTAPTPPRSGFWRSADGQLLLSALFAGLAAAAKYNCGVVIVGALSVLYSRLRSGNRSAVWLWPGVCACAILGFAVGCPGALLDWDRFTRDLGYEIAKSRQGMDLLFTDTGNGWWYHIVSSMRFGMGWWMLALVVASVAYACYRRDAKLTPALLFLGVYYLMIGAAQVRYLRYIIPMLPALSVLIGVAVCAARANRDKLIAAVASGGTLCATLVLSLAMDNVMAMPDARDIACDYIEHNVHDGSTIAFAKTPWYFTPPITPGFTLMGAPQRRAAGQAVTRWQLRIPTDEWDIGVLTPEPEYIVISDIESEDAVRLNYPQAQPFLAALRDRYTVTSFQNTPAFCGIHLGKPAYVPNDWLYTYPRISVYRLRR